jgi:hypothetical protein
LGVDDAADAVSQSNGVEVQEEADGRFSKAQVLRVLRGSNSYLPPSPP